MVNKGGKAAAQPVESIDTTTATSLMEGEGQGFSGRQDLLYFGLELNSVPDLQKTVEEAQNDFDFIATPLVHPRNHRDLVDPVPSSDEPFTRSDTLLNSNQWSSLIVGKISTGIDLDSKVERIRKNSERVLLQELAWATHLNLPAVILPTPSLNSGNYSQIVTRTVQNLMYMQMWVRIPLTSPLQREHTEAPQTEKDIHDPWEWWNNMRSMAEHHPSLSVALEITEDLPSEEVISKWLGEPIKAVIVPTKIFLTNKSGFPTLSKRHQALFNRLFKYKLQYILSGTPKHKNSMIPYRQYIQFLYSRLPALTQQETMEAPYLDFLQAPLQPLMDNLESQTYETFEKDPVKYRLYEEAVYQALLDRKEKIEGHVVLMVVGAGRGPLVRASLRASDRAKKPLKVYAVEKNPNAVITLKNLKIDSGWGDKVTIVDSDMRVWNAPEKADILVSELLGSFGDNELSPECLDGAQRFLKEDGISIPTSYTSFLAPLSSSKLYNEVKSWKDLKHFETPYVVKLHNVYQMDVAQECFIFAHPNKDEIIDNSRYKKFVFESKESATLHGLAGYFDSHLYGDVHMSINPPTFSEGMFSWFPIFFPLRDPIYVPRGAKIEVHMWRNVTRTKVWYEWAVASPQVSPIHNVGGRSYWIGL